MKYLFFVGDVTNAIGPVMVECVPLGRLLSFQRALSGDSRSIKWHKVFPPRPDVRAGMPMPISFSKERGQDNTNHETGGRGMRLGRGIDACVSKRRESVAVFAQRRTPLPSYRGSNTAHPRRSSIFAEDTR